MSQGPHVRKPASGPRRPGRLETRISCEAHVRVRQKASLSSWGSTGWPMWTWEVSTATKRMSRVHCWKRPRGECDHERGRRREHTVLIGAMVEERYVAGTGNAPAMRPIAALCQLAGANSLRLRQVRPQTRTRDKVRQPRVVASREPRTTFNSYHNSLPPVMDEIFSTVHETLQDSLDIVNTAQLFQILTHSPSYRSYQCVRPPRHAREHWKVWSV